RDLHDSVSQTLYAIGLAASRALDSLEYAPPNEVEPSLQDILALANTGQSELRALLTDIRFDPLARGSFTAGLTNLVASFRANHRSLDVRLSLADEPDLPGGTQEELVQIAREALRNVERHSGASCVEITLVARGHELVFHISDDGRGFDATAT